MKKISDKTKKIIISLILIILSIILIFTVFGLIKAIKNRNSVKAINMETLGEITEDNEEFEDFEATEEIDMEKLENYVENETNSSNKTNITDNSKKYYIKVNYGANVVTVYGKDENNNYTVPVKAMVCSTGTGTPRSGTYGIKGRWEWGNLFGGVYGHYVTHIVGNILFHSVPYTKKYDPASIEYWEYDKLGQSASMGCVRLTISDAKWIYNNVATGTYVEFYSSSDPGPLGKPSAQKISGNIECRGWDPTDNNENNPWHINRESESEPEAEDNVINSEQQNNTSESEQENVIVNNTTTDNVTNSIGNTDNTITNTIKENENTNTTVENNIQSNIITNNQTNTIE